MIEVMMEKTETETKDTDFYDYLYIEQDPNMEVGPGWFQMDWYWKV